jgi:hypothetical protein
MICFVCSTYLAVNLFLIIYTAQRKSYQLQSSNDQGYGKVKYIVNLHKWRKLIYSNRALAADSRTEWCDVPNALRILSNSICRMYLKKDCTRLPCHMVYANQSTLDDIKCYPNGKVMTHNAKNPEENQKYFLCKSGYSLSLFLKESDKFSYPSIIADVSLSSAKQFYTNVLNKKFRSPSSVWSLFFNFESIINYPSAANRDLLKLFNVTFGYDRSVYDFIPTPWLFGFVHRLVNISKRLSMIEAMGHKTPIHPLINSNQYWTNTPTVRHLFIKIKSSRLLTYQ